MVAVLVRAHTYDRQRRHALHLVDDVGEERRQLAIDDDRAVGVTRTATLPPVAAPSYPNTLQPSLLSHGVVKGSPVGC
jgi:hypothetical protein